MQHSFVRSTVLSMYALLAIAALMLAGNANAQLYIGGSVGSATVAVDLTDPEDVGEVFEFDENDFAWKAFGGYNWDLGAVDLGVEVGYVDLGAPSADVAFDVDGEPEVVALGLDVDGLDAFAVLGFDIGPIGLFAKAGMVSWDASFSAAGLNVYSEDGSDPAYGIGASFALGNLEIRGEYEMFDLDPDIASSPDVYMLSAGLVYNFGKK